MHTSVIQMKISHGYQKKHGMCAIDSCVSATVNLVLRY